MASEIPPLLSSSPPPMCKVDFSDDEMENDDNQCYDNNYTANQCSRIDAEVGDYLDCSYKAGISNVTNNEEDISVLSYTNQTFDGAVVPDNSSPIIKNDEEITQCAIRSEIKEDASTSVNDSKIDNDVGCNEFKEIPFGANPNTKTTLPFMVNDVSVGQAKTSQKMEMSHDISFSLALENVTLTNLNDYLAINSGFIESFEPANDDGSSSVISEFKIDITKESSDFNSGVFSACTEIHHNNAIHSDTCEALIFSAVASIPKERTNKTYDEPHSTIINSVENKEPVVGDTGSETDDLQFANYSSSFNVNVVTNNKSDSNQHAESFFNEKSFVEFEEIDPKSFSAVESNELDIHSKYTEEDIQTENDSVDASEDTNDDFIFVTLDADLNTEALQTEGRCPESADFIYDENNAKNEWSNMFTVAEDQVVQRETIFDCSAPDFTKRNLSNDDEDDFSDFVSPTNLASTPPETLPCHLSVEAKSQTNYADQNLPNVDRLPFEFVDVNNDFTSKSVCNLRTDSWSKIFQSQHRDEIEVNVNTIEGKLNGSSVWCNIKDVGTSPALNYSWNDSEANRILLSTLYVDSRNILFGPRWSSEVPRFASNLGFTPLVPQKALSKHSSRIVPETRESQIVDNSVLKETSETPTLLSVISPVPDAHFDWNNSGLTNPLDCYSHSSLLDLDLLANFDTHSPYYKKRRIKTDKNKVREMQDTNYGRSIADIPHMEELSEEASKILNNLPNLVVMEKQYIVFPIR